MALTGPLADLAQRMGEDINTGRGARATIDTRDVAFDWSLSSGSFIANHVSSVRVEGASFDAVIVSPAGVPAEVAENAAKPTLASLTQVAVPVKKFGGVLGGISLEQKLHTSSLASAVASVLIRQAMVGFDDYCVSVVDAQAGATGTGATFSAAVLDGVASLVSNGSNPDILILSGADFAGAVEGQTAGAGYQLDYQEAVPMLLGLKVVLSAGAATGEMYVADSQAITVAEGPGPFVLTDVYSAAANNQLSIYGEVFGGCVVSSPGGVAKLTVSV